MCTTFRSWDLKVEKLTKRVLIHLYIHFWPFVTSERPWKSNLFYSLLHNIENCLSKEPKMNSVLFLEAEIWKLQNWPKLIKKVVIHGISIYLSIYSSHYNNIQLSISRKLLGQISSNFHSLGRIRVLPVVQVASQLDQGNTLFHACEICKKSTIFHL